MDSFDPLEETVAADDIGGRNNCPVWQRISAIGRFEPISRVSIVNGSRGVPIAKTGRGKGYKAIPCWAIIEGARVEFKHIGFLEEATGIRRNTLQKHRQAAIKQGRTDTISFCIMWGW